jgi:hypothetical protein
MQGVVMKFLFTILALAVLSGPALAGIEWSWSNAGTGTERGTFITDGAMVSGAAPAGTYTIIDFTLSETAYPLPLGSISDGTYFINQPDTGFDWDGAAPTVFWRSSGTYTNGTNFFVTAPVGTNPDLIGMGIDFFLVEYDEEVTFLEENHTPVVTPVGDHVATEVSSFGAIKVLYR